MEDNIIGGTVPSESLNTRFANMCKQCVNVYKQKKDGARLEKT